MSIIMKKEAYLLVMQLIYLLKAQATQIPSADYGDIGKLLQNCESFSFRLSTHILQGLDEKEFIDFTSTPLKYQLPGRFTYLILIIFNQLRCSYRRFFTRDLGELLDFHAYNYRTKFYPETENNDEGDE